MARIMSESWTSADFKWHTITHKTTVPFEFCSRCVNFESTPITEEEMGSRCVNEFTCLNTVELFLTNFPYEVDVDGIPCIYSLRVDRKENSNCVVKGGAE